MADLLEGRADALATAPGEGVGGKGLSALDKIRARYEAYHALPKTLDVAVPGMPLLGVRYTVRDPDEATGEPGTAERLRRNMGGPEADLLLLVEHCEALLVRDDEGAEWDPLTHHGALVGFDYAAIELLGLPEPAEPDSVEVARAVFSSTRVPEVAASVHVNAFMRHVGEPPTLDDAAALGESSPVPR